MLHKTHQQNHQGDDISGNCKRKLNRRSVQSASNKALFESGTSSVGGDWSLLGRKCRRRELIKRAGNPDKVRWT
jgi:hypothetical protein